MGEWGEVVERTWGQLSIHLGFSGTILIFKSQSNFQMPFLDRAEHNSHGVLRKCGRPAGWELLETRFMKSLEYS